MRTKLVSRGCAATALHGTSALALIAACGLGAPAHAADAPAAPAADVPVLQEVVVTAERRNVDVQKTTIAASVLSGADLTKRNINTVDALQFTTPGLTIQDTGATTLINIRGVGRTETGIQAPAGVLIYRDGVATSPGGFIPDEPYYDLAGVEVLRGPQGTLAGANAIGGAIFIREADPKLGAAPSGWVEGQYGNYNDARLRGAVNVPLSDTLALRLATNLERRDSFYDIAGPWTGNPGDHREADGRISLLWAPTDSFRAIWKTDYLYIDHGGSPAGPSGRPRSQLFNLGSDAHLEGLEQGYRSVLQLSYTFQNGIALRSISGYQWGRTNYQLDYDGTWAAAPGGLGPQIYTVNGTDRTASEEIDLVSPSTGPLTWLAGAVYQNELVHIPAGGFVKSAAPGGTATTGLATQIGYETPKQSWGVFGQVSYDLTSRLQLQVGARYSEARTTLNDDLQLTFNGRPLIDHPIHDQQQADSRLTGKIDLNYKVGEHGLLYAFVATGQKSGGINPLSALASPPGTPAPEFKPETLTDFEIGWKQTFLDGHLRTQVDAYHYDYKNFQVLIFDAASTLAQVTNATGTTTIQGVEGSAQAVFGDLSLDFGAAHSVSSLGPFAAIDSRVAALGVQQMGGRQLPNAPNWTVNVGAEYAFHLGEDTLTPRIDLGYISDIWATVFHEPSLDRIQAQKLVNAQVTWARGRDWTVTAYATNLFDLHYVASLVNNLAYAGTPREFGVRIAKSF